MLESAGFWEALANLDLRTVIIGVLLLLLSTTVTAVLTGLLVPRRTLVDMRTDRDLWRKAHAESEKTRQAVAELLDKNVDLLDKVITQGAITNELLKSLRRDGAPT